MAAIDFGDLPGIDMRDTAALNSMMLSAFDSSFDVVDEGMVSNEYWMTDTNPGETHVVALYGNFVGTGGQPGSGSTVAGLQIFTEGNPETGFFRIGIFFDVDLDVPTVQDAVINSHLHTLWAKQPLHVLGAIDFADVLQGSNFGDTLQGYGGNDLLIGRGGADLLDGMAGADKMRGGPGSDTYVVGGPRDSVIELAGEGKDTVRASVSLTLPANTENLVLTGSGANSGTGNQAANAITGNAGANQLLGKGGGDRLDGGDGNDRLTGHAGADTLTGGAGSDVFIFSAPGAADWILDFSRAPDNLRFDSSPGAFDALPEGAIAQTMLRKGPGLDAALDGDDFLIYDTASGRLYYDADARGGSDAVLVATLVGAPVLGYQDIQVT